MIPARRGGSRYSTDEDRWRAVLRRDREADGAFYYSVDTTGIYCRPVCAARHPRRENVSFHDSWEAAERSGFRACRRCQPKLPGANERHGAIIARACRVIDAGEQPPALAALAGEAKMSPFHFHRIFKAATGLTPRAYFSARRRERLRRALRERATVTEAIYATGYNSNSRFYENASGMLGMHPKTFRGGAAGTTIRVAVEKCSLGLVLVAASSVGICAIFLGDDRRALIRDVEKEFPKARLVKGDRAFARSVARVVRLVDEPRRQFDLPLEVRGTAFQQKVWRELRSVPPGRTLSYSAIAKKIGPPHAVRAVGRACAANVLAVAIPCHRAVRNDGKLSGYRWGVNRKRALLDKEKTIERG